MRHVKSVWRCGCVRYVCEEGRCGCEACEEWRCGCMCEVILKIEWIEVLR